MERIVVSVSGMRCTGCAERIERLLRRMEGVHGVAADHVCGRVELHIDPELTDQHILAERITIAGYRVAKRATQ